ncbi:GNAT family N-acetyltransferase [Desulfopila aestuarii]|nr:GNAT family N-acetyltransferase [Desulfopila aestuarii]
MQELNRDTLGSFSSIIRRQKKKLSQLGRITIDLCDKEDDLPQYLESLFILHKKRWESIGQEGSFVRRPLMQDFYTGFASKAFRKGWLKIFSLKLDGSILAVQIGYLYHGVFYQMQEGFDPNGPGGLGNILRHSVIDWCIANNVREYDYLGGDEEHKLKWGAKQRTGAHLFVGRKSFKNMLLAMADIWPSGKFINEGPPANLGHSHD